MKIKELIIKTNDVLAYILLALVCITAFLTGMFNPIHGAVVGVVGLILFAMLSGAWFVLSSIADSAQKTNVLLEKQNALLLKLYKETEANNVNNQ
ncbi:hypothetical protein [Pseudomonas phage vB_PsaM_M1]|nr:hypothetical protein [Pseudomonas phage vB_PsaM_M1]